MCTFKPAYVDVFEWPLYCNNAEERAVYPELGHRFFTIVPTGAFRPAENGTRVGGVDGRGESQALAEPVG